MISQPDKAAAAADDVIQIEVTDVLDAAPKTALARFDPLRAGLAALKEKFDSYVPDLSTKVGEDAARAGRKELVTIRTSAAKIYDQLNAPLLDAQRQARAMRDEITATAEKYEAPIDAAIKAKELEREAERKRKAEAEAARVKAIRDRIANIASIPVAAVSLSSTEIGTVITDIGNLDISQERFAEHQVEAEALALDVIGKLLVMQGAAAAREAEVLHLAEERAELDRQRIEQARLDKEAADKRAADDAAAAAKLKKEQDELAAQRAAFQAEQEAAAARVREAEDAARRKRDDDDAAQRAFLKKQQDAFEEERRAELERQERENAALAEQRAELVRQQRELEAASAPAPAPAPAPEVAIEEAAAQPDAQESFLPPAEPPTPAAEVPPFYDHPADAPSDIALDYDFLMALANGIGATPLETLLRIKAMDLDSLFAAIEADAEVPA